MSAADRKGAEHQIFERMFDDMRVLGLLPPIEPPQAPMPLTREEQAQEALNRG